MDIFSHGLWAGVLAKGVNKKIEQKPLSFWQTAFWGVFPDLFAFAIPFTAMFWGLIFGGLSSSDFPSPEAGEPPPQNRFWFFRLASFLYQFSHSLPIFLLVFFAVYLVFKRPIWEMSGWLLHIFMDIPTHSYKFFPTPFLWPISDIKINGFSWGTPWFMALNWSALGIVYLLFYLTRNKNQKK